MTWSGLHTKCGCPCESVCLGDLVHEIRIAALRPCAGIAERVLERLGLEHQQCPDVSETVVGINDTKPLHDMDAANGRRVRLTNHQLTASSL